MSVTEFEDNQSHCEDISSMNKPITEEAVEVKSFEVDEPYAADGSPQKLIIDFNEGDGKECTLQDAFIRYQKKRQKELRRTRKRRDLPDEFRTRSQADPKQMWKLRMMFLNQAKKYFGTPYAKKYWAAPDPEYYAPRFLDCCGLIRQILRDLKKEFGFRIGPWNQSYLCDTLPVTVEKEEDMKPGDLVFISAIYHNQKMKKQKHNLTHVEIWLGDGPKTIGARWQRGKVQVFDSYEFNATSYHSPVYVFKSIDTWLMGICRSHCPEHTWKWRSEVFTPGKKSVFYANPQLTQDAQHEEDEGASDSEEQERRPQQAQGPHEEMKEAGKLDKVESTMLQGFSSLSRRITENETSKTVALAGGGTLLPLCQESHCASTAIKSSMVGIVLKSDDDDDPGCVNDDRDSCSPECCIDNIDRGSSLAESPDSDCYESCEEHSDDQHEILPRNCDINDSHDLLNCTCANYSCDSRTHNPDFHNSTANIPSCLCPLHIKRETLFENQKSLQNFHKLSLYQQNPDNNSSSDDAV